MQCCLVQFIFALRHHGIHQSLIYIFFQKAVPPAGLKPKPTASATEEVSPASSNGNPTREDQAMEDNNPRLDDVLESAAPKGPQAVEVRL